MDAMTDLNLKLGLPGTDSSETQTQQAVKCNKRTLADAADDGLCNLKVADDARKSAPAAKAQVVGWPPLRSYWKNSIQTRKTEADAAGIYVKVSMDGAPYLRKIDLKVYNGYPVLLKALGDMFKCFSMGDFSERQGCSGSEFVPTYEDKDGDWMLVGDVPWEMFISSCKRLRIMKGSEARGLGSCA